MTQPNFKDLTGQKFGKLTVIKRAENDKYGRSMWLCECDCGGKNVVLGYYLKAGRIKSCGCIKNREINGKTLFKKIKTMTVDEMAVWITLNIYKTLNDFAKMTDTSSKQYELDTEKYIKMIKQHLLQEVEE